MRRRVSSSTTSCRRASPTSPTTGAAPTTPATGDWTVGSLAVDASASLQITATVTQPGEIVNDAEVTASGLPDPDSTPGNGDPAEDDHAQALVNADNQADLSLGKTVDKHRITIGDTVVYTLTLRTPVRTRRRASS